MAQIKVVLKVENDSIKSEGLIDIYADCGYKKLIIDAATVTFSSNRGGTFSTNPATSDDNGIAKTVFTAPAVTEDTIFIITASAVKTELTTGSDTIRINVDAPETTYTDDTGALEYSKIEFKVRRAVLQILKEELDNDPMYTTALGSSRRITILDAYPRSIEQLPSIISEKTDGKLKKTAIGHSLGEFSVTPYGSSSEQYYDVRGGFFDVNITLTLIAMSQRVIEFMVQSVANILAQKRRWNLYAKYGVIVKDDGISYGGDRSDSWKNTVLFAKNVNVGTMTEWVQQTPISNNVGEFVVTPSVTSI